jgi:hypothetical protein
VPSEANRSAVATLEMRPLRHDVLLESEERPADQIVATWHVEIRTGLAVGASFAAPEGNVLPNQRRRGDPLAHGSEPVVDVGDDEGVREPLDV